MHRVRSGNNGNGKTSLLNILMGVLEPTVGTRFAHHNLRLAYFTQHHVDSLDLSMTPLQHITAQYSNSGVKEYVFRAHLGRFGITGPLAMQLMATLSGGQRSRVVMATVTFQRPHILVLDEPTNHLDFASIDALISAIEEYSGAVLVVSHDADLIERVGKELWVVANQRVTRWDGSFEAYKRKILKELEEAEAGH